MSNTCAVATQANAIEEPMIKPTAHADAGQLRANTPTVDPSDAPENARLSGFGGSRVSFMLTALLLLLIPFSQVLTSCASTTSEPDIVSMALPVGDPALGEHAFRALRCGACHEVKGLPELSIARRISNAPVLIPGNPSFSAGDWATAIVAPAHEISWSEVRAESDLPAVEMPEYYDRMTVGELMDLVAFLGTQRQ